MTVQTKAGLVKKVMRTTTRSFNLSVAKQVEDQAKAMAEAEPQAQAQTQTQPPSGFKVNP